MFTIADEVLDLMPEIGYDVGEPERLAVRAMLPQRRNGRWAGLRSCIIAARQNIKTASMIACAIHDTFIQDLDVVWTAHEFKTSADAFKDFQAIIEGNDELAAEVLRVRVANGSEGYDLRSGATLRIVARSGRSGRGFSKVPRLYLDEGLYLESKMLGAITPTMAAIDNAHLVIGSSPGILTSSVLREIRASGRSGEDQDLGYVEWTSERRPCLREDCTHAPGVEGCALDDEDLWWQANPALDRRISREFLRNQRKVLAAAIPEFMREHMGWWEDPPTGALDVDRPVAPDKWADLEDPTASLPVDAPFAFGADTSWDRQASWIASAGLLPDGRVYVELAASNFGTEWVPQWLANRTRGRLLAVGWQRGGAPVSSLTEAIERDLPERMCRPLSGTEVAAASGLLHDLVEAGQIVHIGQEHAQASVDGARWRSLSDARAIDRKASESDASALVAMAVAVYLVKVAPPQKSRVPRRIR